MTDEDLTPGHLLDGSEFREGHRYENGVPTRFDPHVLYGHEWDEASGQFVLVPLGPRGTRRPSCTGLSFP